MAIQTEISKFISSLKSKYKNILKTLIIEKYIDNDGKPVLYLITILIKKSQRNKGYGNAIMSEITNFADQQQLPMELKVSDIYGSDIKRLINFYRKNNFFPIEDCKMRYLPKKV
jgi:GNAT superfamily N-acetyltransferase